MLKGQPRWALPVGVSQHLHTISHPSPCLQKPLSISPSQNLCRRRDPVNVMMVQPNDHWGNMESFKGPHPAHRFNTPDIANGCECWNNSFGFYFEIALSQCDFGSVWRTVMGAGLHFFACVKCQLWCEIETLVSGVRRLGLDWAKIEMHFHPQEVKSVTTCKGCQSIKHEDLSAAVCLLDKQMTWLMDYCCNF